MLTSIQNCFAVFPTIWPVYASKNLEGSRGEKIELHIKHTQPLSLGLFWCLKSQPRKLNHLIKHPNSKCIFISDEWAASLLFLYCQIETIHVFLILLAS